MKKVSRSGRPIREKVDTIIAEAKQNQRCGQGTKYLSLNSFDPFEKKDGYEKTQRLGATLIGTKKLPDRNSTET